MTTLQFRPCLAVMGLLPLTSHNLAFVACIISVVQIWAIVLAAGDAVRFGGRKQFATAGGLRLVDRAVRTAIASCDAVVVVLPQGTTWDGHPDVVVVTGGSTRAESVRSGLRAVHSTAEIIVVHDAAHPLATQALFESVIKAVADGADAAIPALLLTEPVKRVRERRVAETIPRKDLMLVQTPHAFRAEILRGVHARGAEANEDSVMVEESGGSITVVPGDPFNLHVTNQLELEMVARLLAKH